MPNHNPAKHLPTRPHIKRSNQHSFNQLWRILTPSQLLLSRKLFSSHFCQSSPLIPQKPTGTRHQHLNYTGISLESSSNPFTQLKNSSMKNTSNFDSKLCRTPNQLTPSSQLNKTIYMTIRLLDRHMITLQIVGALATSIQPGLHPHRRLGNIGGFWRKPTWKGFSSVL